MKGAEPQCYLRRLFLQWRLFFAETYWKMLAGRAARAPKSFRHASSKCWFANSPGPCVYFGLKINFVRQWNGHSSYSSDVSPDLAHWKFSSLLHLTIRSPTCGLVNTTVRLEVSGSHFYTGKFNENALQTSCLSGVEKLMDKQPDIKELVDTKRYADWQAPFNWEWSS